MGKRETVDISEICAVIGLKIHTNYKMLDFSRKKYDMFILRLPLVKCIYVCIIHRKNIVIELKTNEKMNPEEHYPQNSKPHSIISYSIKITLHYFQCRISALRFFRSDLSLAILKP